MRRIFFFAFGDDGRPVFSGFFLLLVLGFFLPTIGLAEDAAEPQGKPLEVWTSFTLHELQMEEDSPDFFHLRFRVSLSWDPSVRPDWDPFEDLFFYNVSGEASRQKVSPKGKGAAGENPGPDLGQREFWLVEGIFKGYHDFRGFPFDSHELGIVLLSRSLTPSQLHFVSSPENLDLRPAFPVRIEGWQVHSIGFHDGAEQFRHSTPILVDDDHPAFAAWEIAVDRNLSYAAVAIFLPMLVIWTFSYLGFFWKDSSPASRFGTASIFAAIAFYLGTRRLTPDVGYLLALDAAFFGLYLCIALNALWVAWVFHRRTQNDDSGANSIRRAGIAVAPLLALATFGICLWIGAAAQTDSFFEGISPVRQVFP